MSDWLIPIRWIHVFSGSMWFGEVVVINFILIPVIANLQGEARKQYVSNVFPRVFRMASVLSATSVITGVILVTIYTDWQYGKLLSGRWGLSILVGGGMGLLLTLFHFFMEDKMARKIGIGCPDMETEVLDDVHAKLKIVPRLGLLVISTIFALMMYAVRGF